MTWWIAAIAWAVAVRAIYWVGRCRGERAMFDEVCRQFNLSPEELEAEIERKQRSGALIQLAHICEFIAHEQVSRRRKRGL